jgi:hypothetical protein
VLAMVVERGGVKVVEKMAAKIVAVMVHCTMR